MIPLNKTNLGLIAASIWLCTFSSQFLAQETQSITLNRAALLNAHELISEGRVILDKKGAWQQDKPSAAQKNEFVRLRGFEEYGKWHLGIDGRHKLGSKAHYKFPFGDFKALHRCGLLAVKARAHRYGYADIEATADELLAELKLTRPGAEKRVDQSRQVVAVTAFEGNGDRDVHFAQPLAECRKVFAFESHLQQRIARIGVEARGNK